MDKNDIISREEMLRHIREFRLMDDDFMSKVFDESPECTQLVLRIILNRDDLIVKKVQVQYTIKNLQGRSVRLDVFATDSEGRLYNIEIQRSDRGADARRARYNSSLIDANITEPGDSYTDLSETYVIFITENDVFGQGLPLYTVDRYIGEIMKPFNDGSHIIFVNGSYRDQSPIGRLMHDFSCTEPDRMTYELLARRTRYFKEEPEGVYSMCRVMEDMANRVKKAAQRENSISIARMLLKQGRSTHEEIAEMCSLTADEVEQLSKSDNLSI